MKNVLSICVLFLFFPTLSGQSLNKSNLVVLDLARSFSKQEEVPLSKFLENILFVPLETTPKSIIGTTPHYEVTDQYIIVRNYNFPMQIFIFDRKTGKFIREIGKYGRGPDEYMRFSFIPYDPKKKVLYAVNTLWQLVEYDLSGKVVEIIKAPDYSGSGEVIRLNHEMDFDIMLDDKVFVGYFINLFGEQKNILALFTIYKVLKLFPNYQALKSWSSGVMGIMYDNHTLYRHDKKIYYLEVFSDTLFQLTGNSLIPRYYFKMGDYNVTWQINATADHSKLADYFYIRDINESNKYIFIKIIFKRESYVCFIDKNTNKVTFCKMNSSGNSGFKDDVSGLTDVIPVDITENDEMIYVIQPLDLINWFKNNPEKAVGARKSFPWLKDINEFSNPIIAIGKCKD